MGVECCSSSERTIMSQQFKTEWGGKELSIEIGKIANQANASCLVRYGDTVVLATATMSAAPRDGMSFLPLSVEVEEKLYAGGRIKSSRFMKREGRPTDEAVMTGRMIDRTMRPLFDSGIRNDIQIVLTPLSFDYENDYDIPALIGASLALGMSDIPWDGPVGAVRVGRVGGEWVLNPSYEARKKSDLDLILTATPDRIPMIESLSNEVSEEVMLEAFEFGLKHIAKVHAFIQDIISKTGKPKRNVEDLKGIDAETAAEKAEVLEKAKAFIFPKIKEDLFSSPKATKVERRQAKNKLSEVLDEYLKEEQIGKDKRKWAMDAMYGWVEEVVSTAIVEEGKRVDGRALDEVRGLSSEVGLLPRTHGSALFNRGETQILSVTTLGAPSDEQILFSMEYDEKKRYFHHYGFPPYSVGETGRLGGAGRREIGHGGLAERALLPVLPDKETFPYTIRVNSETMGSNGSSSQGSICGSTLALMDAGVPIKRPVAGIAIGLATKDADVSNYKVLMDLQDLEDGKGGMDFKVGGTTEGITTIQMDTKTKGLSMDIVRDALAMAKKGRLELLANMATAIAEPRPELSPYAPRIVTLKINPDMIRNVIGPGGKVINEITSTTGVQLDVEDDGTVTITSADAAQLERAKKWVEDLTREIKPGELFEKGKVVRIMDFGAFVELLPGQDGLVHISELAQNRVEKVTDVVKLGDIIPVLVIKIDEQGRINLSLKRAKEKLAQRNEGQA